MGYLPFFLKTDNYLSLLKKLGTSYVDLAEEQQAREESDMDGGWGWMVVLGKCPNIIVQDVHCTLYRCRIRGRNWDKSLNFWT
jgi:hypothetical protein